MGLSIAAEGLGRLVLGVVLAIVGGVSGAFLGQPLAVLLMAIVLSRVLGHRLARPRGSSRERLRELARRAFAPMAGLTLIAVLQNVDVIVVKHQIGGDRAGAYASAAVAAKVLIWIALGIGLYLLPEAARRAAAGRDPRPVLARGLGLLALLAVPALAIYTFLPKLLLRTAFGSQYVQASGILATLGGAFALLAAAYLAVQFLLALHRATFLLVLAAAAIAELVVLLAGHWSLAGFAGWVLAAQALAAAGTIVLCARTRTSMREPASAT